MVTALPTKAALSRVLTQLLRKPRTAEVKAAIAKVQAQLRAAAR